MDVETSNGERVPYPGNSETKPVRVFGPGWFSAGTLENGTLNVASERYSTSPWWLFTNVNLFNLVQKVG